MLTPHRLCNLTPFLGVSLARYRFYVYPYNIAYSVFLSSSLSVVFGLNAIVFLQHVMSRFKTCLNVPGAECMTLHEDGFYHFPVFCQGKDI